MGIDRRIDPLEKWLNPLELAGDDLRTRLAQGIKDLTGELAGRISRGELGLTLSQLSVERREFSFELGALRDFACAGESE
jgi:hypothetical protein